MSLGAAELSLALSPRAPEDVRKWRRLLWAPSTRGAACGSACRGWDGGRACEEKTKKSYGCVALYFLQTLTYLVSFS